MAQIANGKTLLAAEIQPGWTVQSDGFGLITSTTTYKADIAAPISSFERGQSHPDTFYSYLKAHKYQISWDNLRYKTIKVDYVGIDPDVGSGVMTLANTSVANGLTGENITTHPNFFESAAGFTPGPLAGLPSDFGGLYDDSTLGPPVTVISEAPGPNFGKPVVVPSSEGYNGACFETGMGGRFIGFVDPDVPELYGKTQYLARTTTYSGVIYTTSQSYVQALYALLGTATGNNSWGIFQLIPSWGPTGTGKYGKQNLLSQVNVEEFGSLYKVLYEIRYSKEGWPPDVYQNI
jgi:hypothetical protein